MIRGCDVKMCYHVCLHAHSCNVATVGGLWYQSCLSAGRRSERRREGILAGSGSPSKWPVERVGGEGGVGGLRGVL